MTEREEIFMDMFIVFVVVVLIVALSCSVVRSAEAQDYTVTRTINGYVIKPTIPRLAHIPIGDPRREMYYPSTRRPSAYAAPSTPRRVQRRRLKYPVLVCRPVGPVLAWIR